ncbi:ParB/Srx family N-terminal domain-containing protein [Lichenihabitans psoromatis]|uniref:ParB/Srx family N-terminal domain-containing protein n=1 Tax=Lichenihabitans psoromatis TaxID=2528642 RepID=UPI001036D039|nr:ParB/Srx family N-terminal domain-containing protein [Lichenihabitans psoromatis]
MHQPSLAGLLPLGQNLGQQPAAMPLGLFAKLQLAIGYVPIASINPYSRNPRTHSKKQIEESLKTFGCVSPLVIDKLGLLIVGHGRLAAAKLLGFKELPVVRLDHLDAAQKSALRILDNQIATLAGVDKKLLDLEFKDLLSIDLTLDLSFDFSITGFAAPEIDKLGDDAAEPDVILTSIA